jgi:hypothetical protein
MRKKIVSITNKKFSDKVEKARQYLLGKGILKPDGSGEYDVEEIFVLLLWICDGELKITV